MGIYVHILSSRMLMNVLHMKYTVEIARTGSINKASEALLVAQPNLSRAVKELEGSLGIIIFDRSSKGMTLTADGENFVRYAQKILNQIDDLESMYNGCTVNKQRFSISVPRASYISQAFARFTRNLGSEPAELFYKETNSYRAIKNILNEDYKLGIIRYSNTFDRYYEDMLEEKELTGVQVAEFQYRLVMSRDSSLAAKENIRFKDLLPFIEIAHGDPYVPSLPLSVVKKEEFPENISRRIFVFERASQFDLLSENPETYMWVSPLPKELLDRYGLVQRVCYENKKHYKDILIRRKDYRLTALDQCFITEVCASREECFSEI